MVDETTPARTRIINIADVPLAEHKHGEAFEARIGAVARPLGATRLGGRVTVVPPGKKAWPFHCHHANDEMFVVIEGNGTLRYGEARHPVGPGDVIVCPRGGPDTAHQIINTSDTDLTYLAVSSMHEPDVMEYPDSGKFGAFAGAAPGGDGKQRTFSIFARSDGVDYWAGEDG